MLTAYETNTRALLQNPSAPTALYSTTDIDRWINIARGQLAGEAECCRVVGTVSTVANQYEYLFSALNIGVSATTGLQGVIHVRSMRYSVGTGQKWMAPRSSPWFDLFVLNNPVPQAGPPTDWCQFQQGAAPSGASQVGGGSFYTNIPDTVYQLNCSCVAYPIPLVDDTTVEAIPYLWTDAVPFLAACYALWSAQNNARSADAERYFNTYTKFVERARQAANPSVNRWLYMQAGDPAQAAKMQIKPGGGVG